MHQLNTQQMKKPKFDELERALGMWFASMEAKKAIITNAVLVAKAREFASYVNYPKNDFKGSNRWLSCFKQRQHREVITDIRT